MRGVVSEAHTPAQCPTFGKVSTPQGAVILNAVCSYWLQRAHYDAVISVKYTSQTASLCHNFCVRPPSQPNCGIGVTQGPKVFGKQKLCSGGILSEKVCTGDSSRFSPIQRWLSWTTQLSTQFHRELPPDPSFAFRSCLW